MPDDLIDKGSDDAGLKQPRLTDGGFVIPSEAELQQKKMERLRSECFAQSGEYVPPVTMRLMEGLVEDDKIFPANAVKLVNDRTRILRWEKVPPDVFRIGRANLPKCTADPALDYSPVDYMAAVYPGGQIFPLRAIPRIQKDRAKAELRGTDPIELREMYRKGLVQVLTGMNPKSADVRKLRGVSSPYDLMALIEVANECVGNPLKEELFEKVVRVRLKRKADFYNECVAEMSEGRNPSKTSQEIYELIEPENLKFVIEKLKEVAGGWAESRGKKANVIPLSPNLGFYLDWFKKDPFWFAPLSDDEVKRHIATFESLFDEELDFVFQSQPATTGLALSRKVAGSKSSIDLVQPFLTQPVVEKVNAVMEKTVEELLNFLESLFKGSLEDGGKITHFERMIDEFVDFAADEKSSSQKPQKGRKPVEDDVEEPSDDMAEVIDIFSRPGVASEQQSEGSNQEIFEKFVTLKLVTLNKLQRNIDPSLASKFRDRFRSLHREIAQRTLKKFLVTEKDFSINDFYGVYIPGSKLSKIHNLLRVSYPDDEARKFLWSLIEAEFEELPDDDFIEIYDSMYKSAPQAGPISANVLAETHTRKDIAEPMPNVLPNARKRLIGLLESCPEKFSERWRALYATFKAKIAKLEPGVN